MRWRRHAISGVVNAGAAIIDDSIAVTHAVRTGAVARAPDAIEAVANTEIPDHVVVTVVDATRVVSGANGVAAAAVRQGASVCCLPLDSS